MTQAYLVARDCPDCGSAIPVNMAECPNCDYKRSFCKWQYQFLVACAYNGDELDKFLEQFGWKSGIPGKKAEGSRYTA